MNTWVLMAALFNIHTGELNVHSNPVASFKTAQECIKALEGTGPRKPDAHGDVVLYECAGPADANPREHPTEQMIHRI